MNNDCWRRPTPEEVEHFRVNCAFDEAWYLREYSDVGKAKIDPVFHYLWLGQKLGRYATEREYKRAAGIELSWCVVATPHVLFIAHMLAEGLRRHGWNVEITLSMPEQFHHDYYIVLCAQMFDILPPGEKRIIYQLEQSASSRWFSEKYLCDMENSFAVLEYSQQNMAFLESKGIGYPLVYYLPVGASASYSEANFCEKDIDVLFYGDYKSSPRRQKMLEIAESQFDVIRADTIFGADIKNLISRSKSVLNIHYYEDAQLETPRIFECLSLGVPVISEDTNDQSDYAGIENGVSFFRSGDPASMLQALRLAQEDRAQATLGVAQAVKFWENRHYFMLDRFLIGAGILPASGMQRMTIEPIEEESTYVLSLPETTARRAVFNEETKTSEMKVFDGIRRRPGWVGCGMSYKYLCESAHKSGVKRFTILEDDALFLKSHEETMKIVLAYLEENSGSWDIFSGVIANLHEDTRVNKVEEFGGLQFIHIDKMTSTVFNIYAENAIKLIADWDPYDNDATTNTIDRYLEHSGLRIVVTDPFIVGHREEMTSTLWGFQNTQYRDMIAESGKALGRLKQNWLAAQET